MKRLFLIITTLLFGLTAQANVVKNEIEAFPHPTQVIVKTKDIEKVLNRFSFKSLIEREELNRDLHLLNLPSMVDSQAMTKDLSDNKNVEWAEPNMIVFGDAREYEPNDPQFVKQHHHIMMRSAEAWEISTGDAEVVVAVTDDGCDLTHEDLADSYYVNEGEIPDNGIDDDNNGFIDDVRGWNINENNNNPGSTSSAGAHGTHVAGIIGAGFNNGVGVTGISPKVKVMPIKFYGSNTWDAAMVYRSYKYAADNGAKIITTSYYIDQFADNKTYLDAVDYAYNKGLLIFNSAGNGNAHQSARTKIQKILLVASLQSGSNHSKHGLKSRFSNYGRGVDIAAPGDPVYSTGRRNQYVDMSGTSMASPNAAAAAAYIWSLHPDWSREQVAAKLMASSVSVDKINSKYEHKLGNGMLDLAAYASNGVAAPFVRDAWYDAVNKEIHIHLRGILNPDTFGRRGVVIEAEHSEKVLEARLVNKYFLGTNVLKVKAPADAGNYRLKILDDAWKDPFGQGLDGDLNGVPGGEYSFSFSVQ